MASHRKIIHIDMDAFYASVEQRDNPELRGKPVAVGGSAERGVVAAASYEARTFGVRSAMPSVTAKRQCPELVFVTPRFEVYKAIIRQIREIFAEHTPLDRTRVARRGLPGRDRKPEGIPLARDIASRIREKIKADGRIAGLRDVFSSFNEPVPATLNRVRFKRTKSSR